MTISSFRNGQLISNEIASDRLLLYGDGVFTTIAIEQGKAKSLNNHLKRLARDCKKLNIKNISIERIKTDLLQLLRDIEQDKCIVRITISRSSGVRGYLCIEAEPVYWITVNEWPTHLNQFQHQGINLRLCNQRLSQNQSLAGIKHCNRLEQVIARNEWSDSEFQEGLMLDTDDNVIEGTMSNLFIIKDDHIYTPDLSFSGVDGIMRNLIIDLTEKLNINLSIKTLSLDSLQQADAIFVSNSVINIWSVSKFVNKTYPRHALAKQLLENLKASV